MKDWLARRPLRWNTTTLHVERTSFDQRLFEIARNQGVAFKWDRVVGVVREGTRLLSCRTADGSELRSSWFVDGSGRTRVLARKLGVEFESYGPHKVSLWAYFTTPPAREATTIYGDAREPYLTWVWEIPVSPTLTSVGCVIAAAELKRRCQSGSKVDDVFRQELARYERFQLLLHETNALKVLRCAHRSYICRNAFGPNWVLAGEAAALPDPLTSNGVTAALRHANDAARLIVQGRSGAVSPDEWKLYERRVFMMGHAFNHGIETCVYESPIRV